MLMQTQPTKLELMRAKRGLTQVELAIDAKISEDTISKIESRAPGKVTARVYVALAAALGCEPEDIIGDITQAVPA